MEERREYPRLDTTKINFLCKKVNKKNVKTSDVTKNISEGGIRLNLGSQQVQPGDVLELAFMLPNRQTLISCKGKVIWAEDFDIIGKDSKKEYEAGVAFFNISEEDKKAIREFVFSILPKG